VAGTHIIILHSLATSIFQAAKYSALGSITTVILFHASYFSLCNLQVSVRMKVIT
jgi:hypothetical protein